VVLSLLPPLVGVPGWEASVVFTHFQATCAGHKCRRKQAKASAQHK
jgi:hypothetical protein